MKSYSRTIKRLVAVLALAMLACLLPACAKDEWKPLFDYADRTNRPTRTPSPTPTTDVSSLFSTPAEAMENPNITVYKSRHILELYDGDTLMARMAVALGTDPVGPKHKDGDGKTPEGNYYVCFRNNGSKFRKSLVISYPNEEDAIQALADGVISQIQYAAIAQAEQEKGRPPWNTPMGGEIAITGLGEGGAGKTGDWTSGNIALSDGDVDYLWQYVQVNTPVTIQP